jgi:hypothetical protein
MLVAATHNTPSALLVACRRCCAQPRSGRDRTVSQDGVGFRSKVHSHLFLLINVFAQLCDDVSLNFTNTTA